jgi:hypothetical protein
MLDFGLLFVGFLSGLVLMLTALTASSASYSPTQPRFVCQSKKRTDSSMLYHEIVKNLPLRITFSVFLPVLDGKMGMESKEKTSLRREYGW